MVELVRLLPRYLTAFLAVTGYVITLFFLAGWAWFGEYFTTLGIDAELKYDGLFSRLEAYLPPGVRALESLLRGNFQQELQAYWAQVADFAFVGPTRTWSRSHRSTSSSSDEISQVRVLQN